MTEDNSNNYARLHLASRPIFSVNKYDNSDTFRISVRFCPKRTVELAVKRGQSCDLSFFYLNAVPWEWNIKCVVYCFS